MGTRIAFSLSALQHSIFSRFSSFLSLFFITFLRWGQFVECLLIWVLVIEFRLTHFWLTYYISCMP